MPHIVIVDPYSSGALLAQVLKDRKVKCVAVESSPRIPAGMKSGFDASQFQTVIRHEDLESTLVAVRPFRPTHVLAGFESGVELAEQLGEGLALSVNGPRHRAARRNKFLMNETVRACGLPTAKQFQSDDVEDILARVDGTVGWPVVMKPLNSVATDQVFCCSSPQEIRQAADAILSRDSLLGTRNRSVLVQEFLEGTEFAVDTVSCNGQRKVTGIWQYLRPPAASANYIGYDGMLLLPYAGNRQQQLSKCTFEVLEALEIDHGPAHCELMWVQGRPILIEVGARLSAGNNAILSRICGGICQLDETVDAMLAPARFLATLDLRPQLRQYAANLFLMPQRQGRLLRVEGLEEIRELPSLYSMSVRSTPGEWVERVAGLVTLVAEDRQALQRDIDVIRRWQQKGIFVVESDSKGSGTNCPTQFER